MPFTNKSYQFCYSDDLLGYKSSAAIKKIEERILKDYCEQNPRKNGKVKLHRENIALQHGIYRAIITVVKK